MSFLFCHAKTMVFWDPDQKSPSVKSVNSIIHIFNVNNRIMVHFFLSLTYHMEGLLNFLVLVHLFCPQIESYRFTFFSVGSENIPLIRISDETRWMCLVYWMPNESHWITALSASVVHKDQSRLSSVCNCTVTYIQRAA